MKNVFCFIITTYYFFPFTFWRCGADSLTLPGRFLKKNIYTMNKKQGNILCKIILVLTSKILLFSLSISHCLSEISALVKTDLWYLICLRHLIRSRAVKNILKNYTKKSWPILFSNYLDFYIKMNVKFFARFTVRLFWFRNCTYFKLRGKKLIMTDIRS